MDISVYRNPEFNECLYTYVNNNNFIGSEHNTLVLASHQIFSNLIWPVKKQKSDKITENLYRMSF